MERRARGWQLVDDEGAHWHADAVLLAVPAPRLATIVADVAPAIRSCSSRYTYSTLTGVLLLLFAVGFIAMSQRIVSAGGFYEYVGAAFGIRAKRAAGYLALLSYYAVVIALWALLSVTLAGFVVELGGPEISWAYYMSGGLLLVGFLGYRDVNVSARVLGILTVAEVLIILILNAAVIFQGGADGLSAGPTRRDARRRAILRLHHRGAARRAGRPRSRHGCLLLENDKSLGHGYSAPEAPLPRKACVRLPLRPAGRQPSPDEPAARVTPGPLTPVHGPPGRCAW